jgi:hypothetical protein
MAQAILDSDTFSEVLAQKSSIIATRATAHVAQFGNFTISALTLFEVQKGLSHQNKPRIAKALTELMHDLVVLSIRKEEAELGGQFMAC